MKLMLEMLLSDFKKLNFLKKNQQVLLQLSTLEKILNHAS
jgi:hypothetical protein